MIKPNSFTPDKKIGIVALAGPMDQEILLKGEAFLKKLGYEVLVAPSCFERHRYLAGESDEARALDLKMMFADDEVGAILNMRGGYGSNRLMPYLQDFNFSKYPKPFIGYSDVTYMHVFLNQQQHLMTYHGPMIKDLLEDNPLTLQGFNDHFLQGKDLTLTGVAYWNKQDEVAAGISVGGNLTILASTLGTPYEVDTRGKVLFLEEVNEEPYQIDRLLMQLFYAGKLEDCVGFMLGDFSGKDQSGIHQTIKEILKPLKKPIAYGIPAGHTSPNMTIPLGAVCRLESEAKRVVFKA